MADIEVTGLDDLVRVARALKAAGDEGKGLRKELYAGLNRATKPVRADLKSAVSPSLPQGGGLAALVAQRSRFSVSTRTAQRTTSVRIVARGKGRRTLQSATQQGEIRHKVFGRPDSWVTQTAGVTPGLLAEQFEHDKPVVRREVLAAIDRVRAQIYRGAR